MKNALLVTLTLIGFAAFAPRAEARDHHRHSNRHHRSDYCDRSGYSRYYAPTYSRTYAPRRYYYDDYRRPYYVSDSCRSSSRRYYSAPRFSISLGF